MPLGIRDCQSVKKLRFRKSIIPSDMSQTVSALFQRPYCFLKSLLVILSYGHDLAHSPHLCPELVIHSLKLLKCPSGKFDYNKITAGLIL